MNIAIKLLSVATIGVALSACDIEIDGGSAPTAAEQACLTEIEISTGNFEVMVLSSEFSQAGTMVTVGVGPNLAPWQCIAYEDGSVDGIMSLTNEGFL